VGWGLLSTGEWFEFLNYTNFAPVNFFPLIFYTIALAASAYAK
jgi:hypothetical protein